jgi:hypothetical protein
MRRSHIESWVDLASKNWDVRRLGRVDWGGDNGDNVFVWNSGGSDVIGGVVLCAEHVEKKGIQDGMQMRASIEERNPVLQERAMTSREGAIGRDEMNATGKSRLEGGSRVLRRGGL